MENKNFIQNSLEIIYSEIQQEIEIIDDEIDIRVESLITSLNNVREDLLNKTSSIKESIHNEIFSKLSKELSHESYKYIQTNKDILKQVRHKIKSEIPKVEFIVSDIELRENLIGELKVNYCDIFERLECNNNGYCATLLSNKRLATSLFDQNITIFDLENYREKIVLKGHSNIIWILKNVGLYKLASAGKDNTIKIWNISDYSCIFTLLGHINGIYCLTLLSNNYLASGSDDKTIKLWDLINGNCIKTLEGYMAISVCLIELSKSRLACGCEDGTICIWNLIDYTLIKKLDKHKSIITCLRKISTNKLASASLDRSIKIWNLDVYNCIFSVECDFPIRNLNLISNDRLVSFGYTSMIDVWDLNELRHLTTLEGHRANVNSIVEFSNNIMGSCSDDKTIILWSLDNYNIIKKSEINSSALVLMLKLSDGKFLSVNDEKVMKILNHDLTMIYMN